MIQLERSLAINKCILPQSPKPNESFTIIIIIGLLILSVLSGVWHSTDDNESNNGTDDEINQSGQSEFNYKFIGQGGWFTENYGQVENSDVKFVFAESGYSIGFVQSGYLLKTIGNDYQPNIVQVTFKSSNSVIPEGREELLHKSNFLFGNDSLKWGHNVRNYQKVMYENIYDRIDLVYYITEEGLKYDLIVHPGGDPNEICFSYDGVDEIYLDGHGKLHVEYPSGELIEETPYSYQMNDKKMDEVSSYYKITNNEVTIKVGEYDTTKNLIIDPLIYSTFIGGSNTDIAEDITLDLENNIYVIGKTNSSDFTTTSGIFDDSYNGNEDVDIFVLKLSSDGSELLFSTFIGGDDDDFPYGISLDSENNIYVSGWTFSSNFPTTPGCFDETYNENGDAFVFKLDQNGTNLNYSTFIGGNSTDSDSRIVLDADNNAYVAGITNSSDFPTTENSYNQSYSGGIKYGDVFVLKLNPNGTELVYSTYVGGSDDEWWGGSLTIDSLNNTYITGSTASEDFPTTSGCYDDSYNGGNTDAIVFKLNSNGSDLLYSTYIGGDSWDRGWRIVLDKDENACITGWTYSEDFPTTPGCYNDSLGGSSDIIVCKLNKEGSDLIYSTLLEGNSSEGLSQIAIDSENNVYISSHIFRGSNQDFPTTPGCYDDSFNGNVDVVVCKLNSNGSDLLYSTYIGGNGSDYAHAITLVSKDVVYITGMTGSPNFPTTLYCFNDSNNGGDRDIYVLKLQLVTEKNNDKNGNRVDDYVYATVIIAGGALGLFGLAFFREDLRFIIISILVIPLYSKIEKDEILDHPNRQKIYSCLYKNPGINFTKLQHEIGIGIGTLVHHLNVLENNNFIHSEKKMGFKVFYPKDSDLKNGNTGKEILLSPPQILIIEHLKEKGISSRMDMEKALNINPNTIQHHLRRLREWKLVVLIGTGIDTKYEAIEGK